MGPCWLSASLINKCNDINKYFIYISYIWLNYFDRFWSPTLVWDFYFLPRCVWKTEFLYPFALLRKIKERTLLASVNSFILKHRGKAIVYINKFHLFKQNIKHRERWAHGAIYEQTCVYITFARARSSMRMCAQNKKKMYESE